MTNREEQEVQRRGGRENRKKRLASSEISIRIHHERGRRMAPAARDDDDDILSDSPTLPARKSERPKVDNTFRSFSDCLPEIEEESGEFSTASFFPTSRRWNEWPPAMRGEGNEAVVGFGRANFAWPIEISGCAAYFILCLTDDRHFEGHKVGGALSPGLIPEPSSSRHCRLRRHSITRPRVLPAMQDRKEASGQ